MTRKIEFAFWHKQKKEMWCVMSIDWETKEVSNGGDIASLDDGVLLQYTGLKDVNGKKIYEGYIVKIMQKTKTLLDKVIYDNHLCGFRFEGSVNGGYCDFCDWLREGAEFEVIGDIYQNPELLKEVEND